MKFRLLPLVAASLFVWTARAWSAEASASASPSPTGTPTEPPAADGGAPATPTPAAASPSPEASPAAAASPSPDASPSAAEVTEAAASPSPAASPTASGAEGTVEEALPAPAASPKAADGSVDILPDPDELGAPVPQPGLPAAADIALPRDDVSPSELPDPDELLAPGGVSELPPAAPRIIENKFQKERELTVRYQEVKLQALKDAAVRSFKDQAEAARTDEAKRQALRAYYRALFAKMIAIDDTLKTKCEAMQDAYIRRLGQYRVMPTIPLQPPPTPAPLPNNS